MHTYNFENIKKQVKQKLSFCNIDDSSEADWLFAEILGVTRGNLALVKNVTPKQKKNIDKALKKRSKGVPLDIIFGHKNFFGLEFLVSKKVLTPRSETELLVEWVIKWAKSYSSKTLLDLCTGSGIIAIVCKKKLPYLNITATDISSKALRVAKKNAKNLRTNINFVKSNMFEKLAKDKRYDIIVSNPPYIKSNHINLLDFEVKKFDPKIALNGGEDGLLFYKNIAENAHKFLNNQGLIALEVGFDQAKEVALLLEKKFENIRILNDYNQIARMVVANKKDGND